MYVCKNTYTNLTTCADISTQVGRSARLTRLLKETTFVHRPGADLTNTRTTSFGWSCPVF